MADDLLHLRQRAREVLVADALCAILSFGRFHLEQARIPFRLQGLGHQAIGRINELIAPTGELCLVLQALEFLRPGSLHEQCFLAQLLLVGEGSCKRLTVDHAQDQFFDECIHP